MPIWRNAIKNGNTADSTSTGSRRSADAGSDYYTAVVNFINHGQYAQAINLLGNMDKSDTRWYYLAALAYMGYGDQEKAMANIRIAVNREPNNANYQSAYNSIRQGINPMGFGFDPFSFFDFSAYTAGAGNTGTHRQQSRPVRRQGGCLLTILRIALAIFIIRLVILGITSLVSWSTQYQHYDVSPGNAYSYSQSAAPLVRPTVPLPAHNCKKFERTIRFMKEKLKQMGYKMQQSMIGRYGIDTLYKALLVIYLILVVTGSALARVSRPVYTILWVLSLAVLIYAIFRSFSRNIAARQRENARWLALTAPIRREGRLLRDKWTFRKTHVFKKCPGCKAVLRLPRKKGKHTVNCPHCHKNFTVHVHG